MTLRRTWGYGHYARGNPGERRWASKKIINKQTNKPLTRCAHAQKYKGVSSVNGKTNRANLTKSLGSSVQAIADEMCKTWSTIVQEHNFLPS